MSTAWASEDVQRVVEGSHDAAAVSSAEAFGGDSAWSEAVARSREELEASVEALRAAMAANVRESEETRALSAQLAKLQRKAAAQYRYVIQQVTAQWVAFDPDDPEADAEAAAAREVTAQRVFTYRPSDLLKLSALSLAEALDAAAEAMRADEGLSALGLDARLAAMVGEVRALAQSTKRERDEDKAATEALNAARAAFDTAARAHRLLVESILVRLGRAEELGRFVLAQDPRYRGRRAAGVPVQDELERLDVAPLPDAPPA